MSASPAQLDLIQRIRRGDEHAWRECIEQYEGRLLAFARSRLRDQSLAEDIVQESFIGFLNALPNYDEQTPLDAFLFAITAHKITDQLRRQGRRPALNAIVSSNSETPGVVEPTGPARRASSLARSREEGTAEELFLAGVLGDFIKQWRGNDEYERLQCAELLFVRGLANKAVAQVLNISEQAVANHKHFIVAKLKEAAQKSHLRNWDPARFGLE